MTLMALGIAVVLIVAAAALVLRGVQQRMIDERQSVQVYQRALETLRHVSEQRVNPLVVRSQSQASSPTAPPTAPASSPPAQDLKPKADPEPARRQVIARHTESEAHHAGEQAPEAVVQELVSGRALFSDQGPRRQLAPRSRRQSMRGAVTAIAAVVVIIASGALAYALLPGSSKPSASASHTSNHAPTPVSKAAVGTAADPATLTATSSTTHSATYQLPADATQVVITATGTCWVDATETSTGSLLWTGTMAAGQQHGFAAVGTMRLRLGAPASVTVTVGHSSVVLPTGYAAPFDVVLVAT